MIEIPFLLRVFQKYYICKKVFKTVCLIYFPRIISFVFFWCHIIILVLIFLNFIFAVWISIFLIFIILIIIIIIDYSWCLCTLWCLVKCFILVIYLNIIVWRVYFPFIPPINSNDIVYLSSLFRYTRHSLHHFLYLLCFLL